MNTRFLVIVLSLALLLSSCSASHQRSPERCISGKVIFTKYLDSNNIYLLDLESGEQSILYGDPDATGIGWVRWSPDGNSVGFPKYFEENADIYVLSLKDMEIRQITNTPDIEMSPAWSPDGNQILTTSVLGDYAQLLKVNADGSGAEQITHENANFSHASWSPDGKQIIYISDKGLIGELWIMNSDGSELQLLSNEVFGWMPKWSPDGKYILFVSQSLSYQTRIVIYDVENRTFNLLIPGDTGSPNEIGYSYSAPMWSADGSCVMFIKGEGESGILYVMDFSSRQSVEILDMGMINSIDWFSE